MSYEGWSLSDLWAKYNSIKSQQSKANSKKERLERAYNALKSPKAAVSDDKKKCDPDKLVDGTWKGNLRKKFNDETESLQDYMKRAYNRMDEYHDDLQNAIKEASKKSGSYIPILSDIYREIKKLTN